MSRCPRNPRILRIRPTLSCVLRSLVLLLIVSLGTLGCESTPVAPPPNIVLLLADDMGYGDLSSYGAKDYQTPHIDAIGKAGARFTQFYANGAECTPTRTALMTGRYPQRFLGMECAIGTGNVGRYDDAITLAEKGQLGLPSRHAVLSQSLKDRGYATAIFGKWHLGYDEQFNPTRYGFDRFFGVLGGNCDYFTHKELSPLPVLYLNSQPVQRVRYMTDMLGDEAVGFIHHNADRPFFLYVPFTAPHFPFQAPGDRAKVFNKDNWTQGTRETYAAMMKSMDDQVGRILAKLAERKVADNTLVIFASDHGAIPPGSNAPFRGQKSGLFEGGIRAPMLASWPGRITPGTKSEQVCATFDLTASILAAAGASTSGLDGEDVLGQVARNEAVRQRTLFWRAKRGERVWRAVRDGDMKYVTKLEDGKSEAWAFDLAKDPGEATSLIKDDGRADEVTRLKALLEAWEKRVKPRRSR